MEVSGFFPSLCPQAASSWGNMEQLAPFYEPARFCLIPSPFIPFLFFLDGQWKKIYR